MIKGRDQTCSGRGNDILKEGSPRKNTGGRKEIEHREKRELSSEPLWLKRRLTPKGGSSTKAQGKGGFQEREGGGQVLC